MVFGLAINENYGKINWNLVKENPANYLMLRAGYGENCIDLQFRRNAQNCNRRDIPFGVYWLSYAFTPEMAQKEAKNCIETIEEYKITYPVCIEYNYGSIRYAKVNGVQITESVFFKIAEAFSSSIREAGYESGVFINS